MSEEPADSNEVPQGGVFGKLPDARPGSRSPRRDRAAKAASAKATAKRKSNATARPSTPRRKRAGPAERRTPAPQRATPATEPAAVREPAAPEQAPPEPGGGLDDLAWAGVAALAEAATFGVRLANRAFGAIRSGDDSDDPR